MSEMEKYYQVLGVQLGASKEVIKQAYKDLVSVWHPDRFVNNPRLQQKANEKLKEINWAYKKLMEYMANLSYETHKSTSSDYEESPQSKYQPPLKEGQTKRGQEEVLATKVHNLHQKSL